jgi:hypothetical protein
VKETFQKVKELADNRKKDEVELEACCVGKFK